MRVCCPNCGEFVELEQDTKLSEIQCPGCSRGFSVPELETAAYNAPQSRRSSTQSVHASHLQEPPTSFGEFRRLELLREGGLSEVWLARDTRQNRRVVLKIAPVGETNSEKGSFRREVEASKRLRHSSIVEVCGSGVEDGYSYIAQRYVEGESLESRLSASPISFDEAVAACSKIAKAINYAHEHGVVHCDLKPSNIIIDSAGEPHILDFGLALSEAVPGDVPEGVIVGTPAYMAPEQSLGKSGEIDGRADIYSLGVILYEWLTGERPFRGDINNLLHQIATEDPPDPLELNPSIPAEVSAICLKCLEKDSRRRFQTAQELAEALDAALLKSKLQATSENVQQQLAERTRMLAAMTTEHRLYRSLVESLPLCVFRTDSKGRFTFANEFFCKTVGRQVEEVQNKKSRDLFPELAEQHESDDQEVMTTGSIVKTHEQHGPDGATRTYFDVLKSPVRNFRGEIIGVQGIMWDVSAHTRAEHALREAKEAAEAANRAKNDFLANISHEIRTPMNAIIGLTEQLLRSQVDEKQKLHLGMVRESGESLLRIINDVLDFARIEAGKLTIDPQPFNIRDLLSRAVQQLEIRAREKGLDLTFHVESDVPRILLGDQTRLEQIITNLVGNATKFTDQGRVALRAAVVSNCDNRWRLHFSVSDTGVGIRPEKQTAIFDAFEQVDSSTSRRFGGTGLGLAIVSGIVGALGGTIWLESEVNKGSTFHFTMEFAEASEEMIVSVQENDSVPKQLAPLSILVVEDVEPNQELMRTVFERLGHQVEIAGTGLDAVNRLKERSFDVVFMDVQMPGVDGFEATKMIRTNEEAVGQHTPIIAVTAHAMNGYRERCLDAGMDDYIAKPVQWSEIYSALHNVLPAFSCSEPVCSEASRSDHSLVSESELTARFTRDRIKWAIGLFLQESQKLLSDVVYSVEAANSSELKDSSHKLKGALGNLIGEHRINAVLTLEEMAACDDLSSAEGACRELKREMKQLEAELRRIAGDQTA